MNCFEEKLRADAVAVGLFSHGDETPHRDPPEERATAYSINFVTAVRFRLRFGTRVEELATRSVFVTRPGLEY